MPTPKVQKTRTSASQADGTSRLEIVVETQIVFNRKGVKYAMNALVAENLADKVIAGVRFLKDHDIYVRFSRNQIHVGDHEIIKYDVKDSSTPAHCSRTTVNILRIPRRISLLPGGSVSVESGDSFGVEQSRLCCCGASHGFSVIPVNEDE